MVRRCPICKKEVVIEGNPFRPFCSDRCKLLDLDNWLSERYRIRVVAEGADAAEEALPAVPDTKESRE